MKLNVIMSSLLAMAAVTAPSLAHAGAADLNACCTPADKDQPKVGANLGSQGYSQLAQINKDNLSSLGAAWMTRLSAVPVTSPAPAAGSNDIGGQSTPIAVDGVIYVDTPSGGVVAVDGATGTTKWKWQPSGFTAAGTRRGVSVGEGKIFTAASGNRVVALDKATGEQLWVSQPTGMNGASLGDITRVATVYHDGMVYLGGAQSNRAAALAVKASDGSLVWAFYGAADSGTVVTDVNGKTVDAGATWGPLQANGLSCALTGGVTPWINPSIDPELGMVYYTFGNVRSCPSSQDGSKRAGDNLFSNTVVALDLKSGQYKWHFQSVRHDVWDMDNVHSPVLADVSMNGQTRKAIYYGSKSGMTFVLDRRNGQSLLGIQSRALPIDSRQESAATQPFPVQGLWVADCVNWEKLSKNNIPGDPWRGVPNYNGYQPNANGELVYTEPNYLDSDKSFVTYPSSYGASHRKGCMYDTHWDLPVLSTTSQNGGADWSNHGFSPRTGLIYIPYGVNNVAHYRAASSNGLRVPGQYQTGGVVALNASTNRIAWRNHFGVDVAHGQHPLLTGSDLLFIGLPDGNFLGLDAVNGQELWRFQTGASISSGAVTYSVGSEQYVAIMVAGTGIPYGNSILEGDMLWAFKLGGSYKTDSGSSEMPTPPPLNMRRPVGNTAASAAVGANTILLARSTGAANATADSTATGAMVPSVLTVQAGTTVTFLNPGSKTFPNNPNMLPHCATQFFEGEFNAKLNPGESFQHTFKKEGEYFYNDCTDPRPTGKVVVVPAAQDVPGGLQFVPNTLNMRPSNGVFTSVQGLVTATFKVPAGYTFDGKARLKAPLSTTTFDAVQSSMTSDGKTLIVTFDKSLVDNNMPAGAAVPLTLSANFVNAGVQKQLTSTAIVRVIK